jgi:hypothetical protein
VRQHPSGPRRHDGQDELSISRRVALVRAISSSSYAEAVAGQACGVWFGTLLIIAVLPAPVHDHRGRFRDLQWQRR